MTCLYATSKLPSGNKANTTKKVLTYKIMPKPLRRPPRRPDPRQRQVSLTIAAAFFFSKGIVLCADSQYTAPGWTKTEGSKIFHRTFTFSSGQSSVAFAFSGSVDYAKMAIHEMWEDLGKVEEISFSVDTVRKVVRERLLTFYAQHFYPHPHYGTSNGPSIEFLIALRSHTDDKLSLFRTSDTALIELSTFGAVGSGTLLSNYLVPIMYRHRNMSLKDVVAIAVDVLYQTKKYVDGCGGNSEFLVLNNDGTFGSINYIDVTLGEQFSDFYDHILRNIFLEACDGASSDANLRSAVESLYTSLQVHRDTVRRKEKIWESVSDTLSGVKEDYAS